MTNSVLKTVYELQGEGLDGEMRYFRKPWFMTMLMFMGMSLCLPLAWLEERSVAAAAAAAAADATTSTTEPLLTDGAPQNGHVRLNKCSIFVSDAFEERLWPLGMMKRNQKHHLSSETDDE